jgi:hypothetical protein
MLLGHIHSDPRLRIFTHVFAHTAGGSERPEKGVKGFCVLAGSEGWTMAACVGCDLCILSWLVELN